MKLKSSINSLFNCYTGFGRRPESGSEAGDAFPAVFLPLMALAAGGAAAAAAWFVRQCGLTLAPVVAGIAALWVFGGWQKMKAASALLSDGIRTSGTAIICTLVVLFEVLAIYEVSSYRYTTTLFTALLYLPVAGAVAMLSAASVMKAEEGPGSMLAAVKGGHMLLGCLLAFVLMLPGFGLRSLAFIAASVLAGPVTALLLQKRGGEEAPYIAALAGEFLFVILLALLRGPVIYY